MPAPLPSPYADLSRPADRSCWSPFGLWMTEPDSGLWITEAGLPGAIVRHFSIGILCGWWWIGFDCNHAGDGTPLSGPGNPTEMVESPRDVYRTWGVVRGWVEELAEELGEVGKAAGARRGVEG